MARRLQTESLLADPVNVELLRLLQTSPRMGISELARAVGMAPPSLRERLQRLEETGIIQGWRLDLKPSALGYPVTAFVRVRPMPGMLSKIAECAAKIPEVVEAHRVTGEDCFVLKVHVGAIDLLDQVLDPLLAFGQTTTSIVVSTTVPPRSLPLPGLAPHGKRAAPRPRRTQKAGPPG